MPSSRIIMICFEKIAFSFFLCVEPRIRGNKFEKSGFVEQLAPKRVPFFGTETACTKTSAFFWD
jgi:hypothetical protein